ncbi:hypothetical protein [uncultured Dialister sp.]|jgi:hypothetical protein|uniref:hypothetical protein n=1 Tax=uncultured Dialister sp. TaxID=278064 RepID=UPI00263983E4|nr:hypothetical protein [uncultured Dialister sp.]
MADSEKLREYKKKMRAAFSRAAHYNFVDWRHMGYLVHDIDELLDSALQDFSLPDQWWDLFNFTFATYIKWSKTNMQESGQTRGFVYQILGIWENICGCIPDEKDETKMLDFILKRLDGRIVDYMEDDVYHFVIGHFRKPSMLAKKRKFIEAKLPGLEEAMQEDPYKKFEVEKCKNYLLQILADEGAPIEEVEKYAASYGDDHTEQMLKIYRERGETDREMKLLQEALPGMSDWSRNTLAYEERLKEIYLSKGMTEKYFDLLETMFYEHPGREEIYKEYRSRFTDEEWAGERETLLKNLRGNWDAMPFFAREKQYDYLMEAAENMHDFGNYEKLLKELYPDRSLAIYVYHADAAMEDARDRRGYRKVKRILKKMLTYPHGPETAAQLAEKYRKTYPRRTSLLEELKEF